MYFSMDTHVGEYPVDVEISPLVAYDGEVNESCL